MSNCTPKVGVKASRLLVLNLSIRAVFVVAGLAMVGSSILYGSTHQKVWQDIAIFLLIALMVLGGVLIWSRVMYVRRAANFLGVNKSLARSIPLRTEAHDRWRRQHGIGPVQDQDV
jgi:hypothetical protein